MSKKPKTKVSAPLMPQVTEALRAEILEHAASVAPRECCGLLVRNSVRGLLYFPATNLASAAEGRDRFELDPQVWVDAEPFGAVVGVLHSHPNASANPSMCDRVMCERSGLPWLIVSWPSGAMVELRPEGFSAPLEGREFAHGVLDCYTLVQDWYLRERGIELPDFDREDGWWTRGQNLYRDGLIAAGFEVVQTREPEPGDGLLMRVASPQVDNHAAVYLGEGYMLHHLYGQLSRRERWDWPWQRRTTAIVRRAHHSLVAGWPYEQPAVRTGVIGGMHE